jgi:hypothetical protein
MSGQHVHWCGRNGRDRQTIEVIIEQRRDRLEKEAKNLLETCADKFMQVLEVGT